MTIIWILLKASFNALMGLSCYFNAYERCASSIKFQCPHGLELLPSFDAISSDGIWSFNALMGLSCYHRAWFFHALRKRFQCPHGLELLLQSGMITISNGMFQCPHGLELLLIFCKHVTNCFPFQCPHGLELLPGPTAETVLFRRGFNALMGLSCYCKTRLVWNRYQMFQCPHGLELLRQECPIF